MANMSDGLPNAPVNCVLYDATTNFLFAGTDVGVYYTDVDAVDWQPFGGGHAQRVGARPENPRGYPPALRRRTAAGCTPRT
ncbi:MAG: hypothetical protein IPL65_12840 [Lewinellaceae bacterium]|nr:hypothetical protein [Lewinellaceae bacterium]